LKWGHNTTHSPARTGFAPWVPATAATAAEYDVHFPRFCFCWHKGMMCDVIGISDSPRVTRTYEDSVGNIADMDDERQEWW
jgi:hypothetical protein